MHISCLIYHVLEAALFWDKCVGAAYLIFSLINYQGVKCCCTINERRLQNQAYRQLKTHRKSKLMVMDRIHLNLAKVYRFKGQGWILLCLIWCHHIADHFLYYISIFISINLNNILTLPQTFVITAEAWFSLTRIMFALFFTTCCSSLQNQNKCKPSKLLYC